MDAHWHAGADEDAREGLQIRWDDDLFNESLSLETFLLYSRGAHLGAQVAVDVGSGEAVALKLVANGFG
jgi:hypothetical protein